MRGVRGPAFVVAAALATGACASTDDATDAARRRDEDVLAARAAEVERRGPQPWIVIEDGALAAFGATAGDAIRAAPPSKGSPHRFVFRADDRGDRLHRLTFLPEGGLVAGRRFLADLGGRVVSTSADAAGRIVTVEVRGVRRRIDLARTPALRLELAPLGGGAWTSVPVPFDPDFDGPLLLTAETASPLALARAEIPGRAEVQAAIGRPLVARRAWAEARCPELDASGVVEVAVPAGPARR